MAASPGDVLHFRWNKLVLDASRTGGTTKQRNTSLRNDLVASTVTIELDRSGSTTCPAYAGTNAASDLSTSTLDMRGVNIDCKIPITTAGTYRVRPTVAWKPGLTAYTARLEVRRDAK